MADTVHKPTRVIETWEASWGGRKLTYAIALPAKPYEIMRAAKQRMGILAHHGTLNWQDDRAELVLDAKHKLRDECRVLFIRRIDSVVIKHKIFAS